MNDADNGRSYACVRVGIIWEFSVPPYQFCCRPRTALKNKVLKKRRSNNMLTTRDSY